MLLGLTAERALQAAALGIVLLVALGIVLALAMKAVVMKVLSLVVMLGLAALVWSQRAELRDCADRVKAEVAIDGLTGSTTCRFFGTDVTVRLPTP